jgi:ubiquinone/menaquinone biosynthesis C-methylase UbiE
MKPLKICFYDAFSHVYDAVIALHSRDPRGELRTELVDRSETAEGEKVLDLCTGTGSTAVEMARRVGERGMVVGVDFSRGMLKKAQEKSRRRGMSNICWVEALANRLPFRAESFSTITCCYALYELKDSKRREVFREVVRALVRRGKFMVMEHETPVNVFIRFLFYLRIVLMGSFSALRFVRHELSIIGEYFPFVNKYSVPSGKSKIIVARKEKP